MGLHNLNQERLFIGIMIVDTGCLDASQASYIAQRCRMVASLSKKFDSSITNFFSHRTSIGQHSTLLFFSGVFYYLVPVSLCILPEMPLSAYPSELEVSSTNAPL